MAKATRKLLDTTTPRGKRIAARLKKEIVIWLATVNPDGRPLVVPVWFIFDGVTFLIYSVPGLKVRNIERNALVSLQLNSNFEGGDIVVVEGKAQVLKRQPPAHKVPAYMRKYASHIKSYGWTGDSFSADYRIPIRVRATRFRGGE
jgi:PPOX class probable F420-dependent enzyme